MWSFSKPLLHLLLLLGLSTLALVTGCMSDSPTETDMPWAAPASWEGTVPLPGSQMNRND